MIIIILYISLIISFDYLNFIFVCSYLSWADFGCGYLVILFIIIVFIFHIIVFWRKLFWIIGFNYRLLTDSRPFYINFLSCQRPSNKGRDGPVGEQSYCPSGSGERFMATPRLRVSSMAVCAWQSGKRFKSRASGPALSFQDRRLLLLLMRSLWQIFPCLNPKSNIFNLKNELILSKKHI